MPKKINIENSDSDSDTLTKSKQKKILPKDDDETEQAKPKQKKILPKDDNETEQPKAKPKKKMSEKQLDNLKKGHEKLKQIRDKNKLEKKIEASKILLENDIKKKTY
jgi:hypothetical protein